MVILSDFQGYILRSIVDDGFRKEANKVRLCEGANWSEQMNGTNAIGTSLFEKKPIKVYGQEHFVKKNHILACAASPIFDPDGQILATLDATGDAKAGIDQVFRLIKMAAKDIERELQFLDMQEQFNLHKAKHEGIVDLIKEGSLFIDKAGIVSEVNPVAARAMGIPVKDLIGKNIQELSNIHNLWVFNHTTQDKNALAVGNKSGSALFGARAKKICDMNGNFEGIVAIVDMESRIEKRLVGDSSKYSENSNKTKYTFDQIVGKSVHIDKVIAMCKRVARGNSTVLLTGETGTGKEMFAQSIHGESERRTRPFIGLNCAAIPAELLESELFGYEEGAFTGARKGGNPGKFEQCHGGTLFLDEIGDMPLSAQTSLLRVLQEKQVCRIGGRQYKEIDVRIIAATHRDLNVLVKKGLFRQDLFFRLNVVNISIPPLQERKEDIELLAIFFFEKFKTVMGRPTMELLPQTIERLKAYSWPGNIRELENTIERLVNVVEDNMVTPNHLSELLSDESDGLIITSHNKSLKDIEQTAIRQTIIKHNGDLKAVISVLGIGKSTLYRKIAEYGIEIEALLSKGKRPV
jgi:transcriptional regulator with PAS, ATPase and Fis domain